MKTLSERIKYLRTKYRLTQKELGKRTGISRANIIRIEQGDTRISSDFVIALAEFFMVTTDWLLLGNEEADKYGDSDMSGEELIKYACSLLDKLEEERLKRVVDFIEFELRQM